MKHAFIYYNEVSKKYIMRIADYIGWKEINTKWQCDDEIGESAFVPHIDIEKEKAVFDTLQDAEYALAYHYATHSQKLRFHIDQAHSQIEWAQKELFDGENERGDILLQTAKGHIERVLNGE